MKQIMVYIAAMIFVFQSGLFSSQKKLGVVLDVNPKGIAVIHSAKGTADLKSYTEICAGDVIEIQKSGRVEIVLTNFEKIILKNPRKIKIQDNFTLVDVASGKQDTGGRKRDKFTEDLAKDMAGSGASHMGASRGSSILTKKILNEVKEAESIEDEFLRHTAIYNIYRKYDYPEYMKKEANILNKLNAEGKGYKNK